MGMQLLMSGIYQKVVQETEEMQKAVENDRESAVRPHSGDEKGKPESDEYHGRQWRQFIVGDADQLRPASIQPPFKLDFR